jgi:hypothetical protein
MLLAFAALSVAGCGVTLGGGPVVGLGPRGLVGGAEVSGGASLAQLTGGVEHTGRPYARVDFGGTTAGWRGIEPYSGQASDSNVHGAAARIGVGYAFGQHHDVVFALGGGYGRELGDDPPCETWRAAAAVTVELRYSGDWHVVLAPRIEAHRPMITCRREGSI